MMKKFKLLIVCIVAVCFMATGLNALAGDSNLNVAQQVKTPSTLSPDQKLDALKRFIESGVPPIAPKIIAGVPDYTWRHGCGPTALGNVVGYYDGHGYGDLITGNAATQTNDVNQAIASGGDSAHPNPVGSEKHYEDYARPEDYPGPLIPDDYITQGRIPHTNDCIGDYMNTSKSSAPWFNQYGWSWSNDMGPAWVNYVNLRNASYGPSYVEYSPVTGIALTWAIMKNEIDHNRPMVFLVDDNGDNDTDHFVTVVGYDTATNQYGFLDTWNLVPTGIRWETFQFIGNYQPWSIWGGWSFQFGGEITKYQQLPDLTTHGIDIRIDDTDGGIRNVADDFLCTTTGPITDVHFWGSWKNDLKGQLTAIEVSIYSNDANAPYSKPCNMLWHHVYMAGEFTETLYKNLTPEYEWWLDPNPNYYDVTQYGDHQIWKYDINIDPRIAFYQKGTPSNPKVYWLELQAWLPYSSNYKFGWKTSQTPWNDAAVFALGVAPPRLNWINLTYPQGHPQYPQNINMAFAITTGAEPNMPTDPNTKFKQPPDETHNGIDVRCDRQDQKPRILADDFVCFETGAITDVHLWGSWLGEPPMKGEVNSIHLSIHSDIPEWQNPYGGYSMPGPVLWQRDISRVDFRETLYKDIPYYEGWMDPYVPDFFIPNGDRQIWQYDIVIPPSAAFIQQGEPNNPKIYWLDVYVQVKSTTPSAQFGWKTSSQHFNDTTVYFDPLDGYWKPIEYPYMHPYHGQGINMDMAFSITNKKECMKPWASGYPAGTVGEGYNNWVAGGKPNCWCYQYQPLGDADGKEEGTGINKKRIGPVDLGIFKPCYGKKRAAINGTGCMCADFDHRDEGTGINKKAIGPVDLGIFKTNYGKKTAALNSAPYAADYSYWIIP